MRAATAYWGLRAGLLGAVLAFAATGGAASRPPVAPRKVAVRAKPVATVPKEDGRVPREDRGRIESRIIAARAQVQQGQYTEAVLALLRALAETQPLMEQQVAIFDLLGVSYVALGQLDLAVGCFVEVLRRRPDFALDPVKTSPKVRAALATARSRL
jgi:tetratricopeptide (TPR) repeat protein